MIIGMEFATPEAVVSSVFYDGKLMLEKIYKMMKDSEHIKVVEHEGVVFSYPGKKMEVYNSEDVAMSLMKHIRERVEEQLQDKVRSSVIAVPVSMDCIKRKCILKAAKEAGLESAKLINNTTAVATAFRLGIDLDILDTDGRDRVSNSDGTITEFKIVVIDMGVLGVNVSVIGFSGEDAEVLAYSGNSGAGEGNILQNLIGYLKEELACDNNEETMMGLIEVCEQAMVKLESSKRAKVRFNGIQKSVERNDLESMSEEVVKSCEEAVKDALGEAGISTHDVQHYILIGRAMTNVFLKKAMTDYFGKNPCKGIDVWSVSKGASIQAVNSIAATDDAIWKGGCLKDKAKSLSRFKEVCAKDVFVADSIVIPKLTPIPVRVVHKFENGVDVYQGEALVKKMQGSGSMELEMDRSGVLVISSSS